MRSSRSVERGVGGAFDVELPADATAYFQDARTRPYYAVWSSAGAAHRPLRPRHHSHRPARGRDAHGRKTRPRDGRIEPRAHGARRPRHQRRLARALVARRHDCDGRARRRGGVARRRLVSRRPGAGASAADQRDRPADGGRRSRRAHRRRANRHRARPGGVGPQPRVRSAARLGRAPAPFTADASHELGRRSPR